jgi:hypothetical protein
LVWASKAASRLPGRARVELLLYNFVALAAMQLFGYSHFMYAFHRFGYPDRTH